MSIEQISCLEAFEILQNNKNSLLVDVRTIEELKTVGAADDSAFDGRMIALPWRILPDMALNSNFSELFGKIFDASFGALNRDFTSIFLICRSGARSNEAAQKLSELGFKKLFNVESGFEGQPDSNGQRGNIDGWKAANLPWKILND